MPLTTQDVAVCAAAAALAYAVRVYSKKSNLPYPPGPQGFPLIGNLGFPEDPALWKKVRAMSEEYGMVSCRIFVATLADYVCRLGCDTLPDGWYQYYFS